jgi:spermidine synthase
MARRRVFVGIYAASGAAALVYEVAWTRLLTLDLGHSVAAASTVLAAFMGGLALGAWIAGRTPFRAPASSSAPLRAYALLEIGVALAALLLPAALAASVPFLAWAYADGGAPARFALVRIALSLGLLGVPAVAMGATFPIAVGWFARAPADAGVLYAANTAGAAAGAIASGFWLIPALGLSGTTWIGVALNAIAASAALYLSRTSTAEDTDAAERAEPPQPIHAKAAEAAPRSARKRADRRRSLPTVRLLVPQPNLAYAVAAVSGFVALVYEVAWTRLIALIIGPTTYAFAAMAASFITGLAIGSAIGTRIARASAQSGRAATWLAATLVVCALSATAAGWFAASRLPLLVAAEVSAPNATFGQVIPEQVIRVALLLLPMTLALGAAFPLAIAAATQGSREAADVIEFKAARVYAWNTLGAIAGALAGGFALIPALGLRGTFHVAASTGIVAGALCLAAAVRPRTTLVRATAMGALTAVAGAAIVAAMPAWDRDLLASGAYKYAPYMQSNAFDAVLRAGTLEYYKEGAASTVAVRRLAGVTSLSIDGKVDASNGGDMLTQRLLGLLPMLLHRSAHDICVIGLGSGVTLGSALAAGGVRRADVVEISPEVVEASHGFDVENGRALDQPGVRLIVGDGRAHLRLTPRTYDVIVSEPSNPWMAGVAALFTREFFQSARARLAPDGLLCQWAHTYDISRDDLRSIVATFRSVFPQGTMWMVGEGDLLLIGSPDDRQPLRLDGLANWRRGGVAAALSDVALGGDQTTFALASLFVGGPDALRAFAGGAPLQRDDRMALEFSAPRGIYGRMANENEDAIRALAASTPSRPPFIQAAFDAATDASWRARGRMELKADAYDIAYDAFHRAAALNPHSVEALAGLTQAAAPARKTNEEMAWLRGAADADPRNVPVRIELSRLLAATGDAKGGLDMAAAALHLAPDDPAAAGQLASVLADANDVQRLAPLADALVRQFPDRGDAHYYRASALFMSGRATEAIDEVRKVTSASPTYARALNLLGAACATAGRSDCAKSAFQASIQANPRDSGTYVNLGTFFLQAGDPARATEAFAEALAVDPGSAAARAGLDQARSAAKP